MDIVCWWNWDEATKTNNQGQGQEATGSPTQRFSDSGCCLKQVSFDATANNTFR